MATLTAGLLASSSTESFDEGDSGQAGGSTAYEVSYDAAGRQVISQPDMTARQRYPVQARTVKGEHMLRHTSCTVPPGLHQRPCIEYFRNETGITLTVSGAWIVFVSVGTCPTSTVGTVHDYFTTCVILRRGCDRYVQPNGV